MEGEAQREKRVNVRECPEDCTGGEWRRGDVAAGHGGLGATGGEHLDGRIEVWIGNSTGVLIRFQSEGDCKAPELAHL